MQDEAQAGSPLAASGLQSTPRPGDSQRSPHPPARIGRIGWESPWRIFEWSIRAARHGIGLMLSGHVHNDVSTGTGTWGPPMRLGSRSEIVFLEPMQGSRASPR